jgi:phosphoglycerate dehydrogenase-like enzyme
VGVDRYDGSTPLPTSVDEVEFFVLPLVLGPGPAAILDQLPRLRVVQALSAGVEDIVPLVPPNVALCNASSVHSTSTAEMAVALVLAAQRDLVAVSRRDFVPDARLIWPSLADRRVLILGYGAIGRAVEARLAGFECEVRRVARRARPDEHVDDLAALPRLLAEVEIVIVCLPLTSATRGLVNAAFLATLPDGALVVNVARGPVIDTAALVAEVQNGRLRAALDVTDPEPLPTGHPLRTSSAVLVTPHVAGRTNALAPRLRDFVHDQVLRYVHGEPLHDVVTDGY